MTNTEEKCVVGILVPGGTLVKALDVCINGQDVYANYSDCSTPAAHMSYHASGQQHMKRGSRYVEWTGGPTGQMEPMKFFRTPPADVNTREDFFPIGWDVGKIPSVLPALNSKPDFLVDARCLAANSILAFYVSIVGNQVEKRSNVSGYPVVASHLFGSAIRVEIDAFIVSEESSNQV
jgi:hypothetical protein